MENLFRGAVYSKFKSVSAFSACIGWGRQKTANIVNGISEPTIDDLDKIAKTLNLSFEEAAQFFLSKKSQT